MKPHYRLHCNLEDRKPLWWVSARVNFSGVLPLGAQGICVRRKTTNGYSAPRAAVEAARNL
jgi:hypothetical protein